MAKRRAVVRSAKPGFFGRVKRAVAELFGSSSYAAADTNRLLADWVTSRLAPDDEMRWNFVKLRSRARDLQRNNALIRNYLRLLGINVIGPDGVLYHAEVRNNNDKLNDKINDTLEDGWNEWALAPTIDGRTDLTSFSQMVLQGVARDGEAFVRKWLGFDNVWGFALEYIDPDLVDETYNVRKGESQNEIRMGIESDEFGRPIAYYIWNRLPGLWMNYGDRKRIRVPADEMIHLYCPERAKQSRGVSWLASIMVPAKMLDGYVEAELVAARAGAAKMGFFQRKEGAGMGALPEKGTNAFQMEVNPGTFEVLPDGYELSTFDPTHPGASFGQFVKDSTRRIAVGVGVSYNGLASDLENVTYSSMRSGLLLEKDVWRNLQQWWINKFLRNVHRDWLNMALLVGAVKFDTRDFRKFLSARWSPRGWQWVDPLKDTQAGVLGIQTGLTSRTDLLAEQGLNLEDVLERLKEEKDLAAELGIDISGPVSVAKPLTATETPADEAGAAAGGAKGNMVNGNGHARTRSPLRFEFVEGDE
jgi:lambda family phage portal protein